MTLIKNNDGERANSPNLLKSGDRPLKGAVSQNALYAVLVPFIVLYAFQCVLGAWGKWGGTKWASLNCERRCVRSLHHRTSRRQYAASTQKCPPEGTITRDFARCYPIFELDFVN